MTDRAWRGGFDGPQSGRLTGVKWFLAVGCVALVACGESSGDEDVPPITFGEGIFGTGAGTAGIGDGADDGGDDGEPTATEGGTEGGMDGEGQLCCDTLEDCPKPMLCVFGETEAVPGETEAVSGECVIPLEGKDCLLQSDCLEGQQCVGAQVCGCQECTFETAIGVCETPTVPEGCCDNILDCNPGQLCLKHDGGGMGDYSGICIIPAEEGKCWRDSDCEEGSECDGSNFCGCGAMDCEPVAGACSGVVIVENCHSNSDCSAGSCMAGTTCTDLCAAGDPACCEDNVCIPEVNQCTANEQCGPAGNCIAGNVCYDFCDVGDPSCCFGNTCFVDSCPGINPQGCHHLGCAAGQQCEVAPNTCVPTACTCDPIKGWTCTEDCVGGTCVASQCAGPSPAGCKGVGCPEGYTCQDTDQGSCTPSACSCDSGLSAWTCTPDCGGGVCALSN